MRILIVYATRYGGTQGIAERLASALAQQQLETTLKTVDQVRDLSQFDAVVIGSAAYYFHWRKEAAEFVRRNQAVLAERPVWLFSSGPLGTKKTDDQGRDLLVVLEPKEIAEFRETIHPRDHRVFFGALLPERLGFLHRLMLKLPANRDHALFPEGDFRDWSDIDAWALKIADTLHASASMSFTQNATALG